MGERQSSRILTGNDLLSHLFLPLAPNTFTGVHLNIGTGT